MYGPNVEIMDEDAFAAFEPVLEILDAIVMVLG
jgi:hypothetical protein